MCGLRGGAEPGTAADGAVDSAAKTAVHRRDNHHDNGDGTSHRAGSRRSAAGTTECRGRGV